MSKLFYSDPFKAAYMSREFGISLQYWFEGRRVVYSDRIEVVDAGFRDVATGWHNTLWDIFRGGRYLSKDKLYIHPDSLLVFEPKAGDLVCGHTDFTSSIYFHWSHSPRKNESCSYIIQRDNKAFFMPEVEV